MLLSHYVYFSFTKAFHLAEMIFLAERSAVAIVK